jgi:uncharacterized protein (DUF58 family)
MAVGGPANSQVKPDAGPGPADGPPVTSSASQRVTWSSFLPREGRLWLAAAAVLMGIGLYKTINLLALLGCLLLGVWLLNALLAGRGLRCLAGRRWVPGPIFAGTSVTVTIEVTNRGPRALAACRLEDGSSGQRLGWFVPALGTGETLRCAAEVDLPHRGRHVWGPLLAASGYPFGLVRREVVLAAAADLLVWPRLGRLQRGRFRQYLPRAGLARDRIRREARRHPTAHTEFHGLRDFRSGDSPRCIHWRTSARCGELMVREFEDVPTDDLILVVDPSRAARTPADATCPDLEAILSLAATLCWEWCRQRGDRLMLIVAGPEPIVIDGLSGPEHVCRLLDCLAVVEPQPCRAPDAAPIVRRLQGESLPAAPIVVLGAGPSGLGEALGQHLRRPVAVVTTATLQELDCYDRPAAGFPDRGPRVGDRSTMEGQPCRSTSASG